MTPSSRQQGSWLRAVPAWPRWFPARRPRTAAHGGPARAAAPRAAPGGAGARGAQTAAAPSPECAGKSEGSRGAQPSPGHRKSSKVDVVVGEADPSSFAILYYQKGRSISVKLYGRSSLVSDAIVDKFEQRVRAVGLSEDVTYYFPTYGFCDSADEFHVLDETKL